MMKPSIFVRPARMDDSAALVSILNEIIEIGGTTAHQIPLDATAFGDTFLQGPHFICCHVAEDSEGMAAGFQALEHNPRLPKDWGDIATFSRVSPKTPGTGTALFAHTLSHARTAGLSALNATIRADNVGGLAFYDKISFSTYRIDEAVPLDDGTPVDRVSKKFDLSVRSDPMC